MYQGYGNKLHPTAQPPSLLNEKMHGNLNKISGVLCDHGTKNVLSTTELPNFGSKCCLRIAGVLTQFFFIFKQLRSCTIL